MLQAVNTISNLYGISLSEAEDIYSSSRSLIQSTLSVNLAQSESILNKAVEHLGNIEGQIKFLKKIPKQSLVYYINHEIKFLGINNFLNAVNEDRPIFLVGGHFVCGYYIYTLLSKVNTKKSVLTIKKDINQSTIETNNNIEQVIKTKLIDVKGGPGCTVRVYKHFMRKNILCSYFDYHIADGPFVISYLFGREIACPSATLSLCYRTKAIILPTFCVKNKASGKLHINIEKRIDTGSFQDENEYIVYAANKINSYIEQYITEYPDQWQLWDTLSMRYSFTQSIL